MVRFISSGAWLTLLLAVPALASIQEPVDSEQPPLASALIGAASTQPVNHIPAVDRIAHWQTLDPRHVLLSVDAQRSYVLTLTEHCHPLNWAQSVDVSRSDNAIWAEFDYVAADGQRCSIGAIHQLDAPHSAAVLRAEPQEQSSL